MCRSSLDPFSLHATHSSLYFCCKKVAMARQRLAMTEQADRLPCHNTEGQVLDGFTQCVWRVLQCFAESSDSPLSCTLVNLDLLGGIIAERRATPDVNVGYPIYWRGTEVCNGDRCHHLERRQRGVYAGLHSHRVGGCLRCRQRGLHCRNSILLDT